MNKKIKIITLGDHPLSPSGVGTQTFYFCEGLMDSGKFEIISLGGAIRHHDYNPIMVDQNRWGNGWRIFPIDGYGTPEMIRSIIRNEKPDMIWIMTDPRFYEWLWSIENEIRPLCPIVYYHVWDNFPAPMFNRKYYLSNDHIVAISKLTNDVVKEVAPEVPRTYLPHAVANNVFSPVSPQEKKRIRESFLPEGTRDRFIIFWNNRNARRKQSGTLIFWFKEWMEKYKLEDKVLLLMHTDPFDGHGQDLVHISSHLGLTEKQLLFSTEKVPLKEMSKFYNMADVTVNLSDAEGFGLATLESLSCATPIIVTMTGGLQEQVITNDGKQCGIPLFPSSKAIIGSQQVPYIYEDRLNKKSFISAINNMYSMDEKSRIEMGYNGREHIMKNYNFDNFQKDWVKLMLKIHKREGSWETRKKINRITFKEIK